MNESEEIKTETRAMTKFTAEDAREVGLPSPTAINFMMSVAGLLSASSLVSKDMGLGKDQVARYKEMGLTPAEIADRDERAVKSNAMAKMLVGRELHMEAMESLQDIDIVKNRIFVRYPQLIRQMELKGYEIEEIERSNDRAAIKITKPGKAGSVPPKPQIFEFNIEDARRAGLMVTYNSGEKSQYEKRPRVMLWARVVSDAFRATGGRANVYTPEEKPEIISSDALETERDDSPAPAYTVGRKTAPGSDAEFAAAGKAAAGKQTDPPAADSSHVGQTPEPDATKKPATSDSASSIEGEKQEVAPAKTLEPKKCACVDGNCQFLSDGAAPEGRFCREGRDKAPAETAPVSGVAGSAGAPTPKPELVPDSPDQAKRKKLMEELTALTDHFPEVSPKTVNSKYNSFFRGVLDVQTLPKDPDVYFDLLPALRAAIAADKKALWSDPTGAGRIEAADRKFIAEKIAKWKWTHAMLPVVLRLKYFFGVNGGTGHEVCEYIGVHELQKVSVADAEAFLRMAAVSREVYRIKDLAKKADVGYAVILDNMQEKMDKPIDQFTEKEFIGLLEIGEKAMADKPAESSHVGHGAGEQEALPWNTEE